MNATRTLGIALTVAPLGCGLIAGLSDYRAPSVASDAGSGAHFDAAITPADGATSPPDAAAGPPSCLDGKTHDFCDAFDTMDFRTNGWFPRQEDGGTIAYD